MTDPVEALAAALAKSGIVVENIGSMGNADQYDYDMPTTLRTLAALRASGFDVVPTGDAGLDVERVGSVLTRWAEVLGHGPTVLPTADWFAAEYARLSSSDTGGRG